MGMFDTITVKCPFPISGYEHTEFQTKAFKRPFLDRYEIREDGTLWREVYDYAEGDEYDAAVDPQLRLNRRWVKSDWTGDIILCDEIDDDSCVAYFKDGKLTELIKLLDLKDYWGRRKP